jgi:multimeric flavodoxin WrbA
MNVLAFNSSPSMDKGNTALILNPFLKGMKEAGADVDLLYTSKLKINPCQGDFNCVVRTPGECCQKDDMQAIYPKSDAADVIVFATPLYADGMNASMKNLIERLWMPKGNPFLELRDGHTRHSVQGREGSKDSKVVLISNCGFWEIDNFTPLIEHIRAICRNVNFEFAGALLRPHGPVLRIMLENGAPVHDVLEAAENAGHQLVTDNKMSQKTLSIVSRELLPLETYVKMHNQSVKKFLEKIGSCIQTKKSSTYLNV